MEIQNHMAPMLISAVRDGLLYQQQLLKSEMLRNRADYEEHVLQLSQFLEFLKEEYRLVENEAGVPLEKIFYFFKECVWMLRNIYLICFLLVMSGCSQAQTYETLEVAGHVLKLDTKSCQLDFGTKIMNLDMGEKCHFIKEGNTEDVIVKYYSDKELHVVLIVGDSVIENPEYPVTMNRDDCGSIINALLVNKNNIRISSKTLNDTVTCASVGVDEKEYYMLSH